MFPARSATTPFAKTPGNGRCRIAVVLAVSILLVAASSCNLLGPALSLGMVKLQFGCLPEGTCIDTASGPVEIEDLKSGDVITGFHGNPVRITQIHQYQEDPATSRYLTVHFTNGSAVTASPRHRITGTPAASLEAGDRCGSHVVDRIEPVHGVSRSFDLLTEDAGYRIAGISVNSMIAEMRRQ